MPESKPLISAPDSITRCKWCGEDPLYTAYHDDEWGRPTTDDTRLFEKICLEGFQAGLSWITILRKRDSFRAAFHDFRLESVAAMGESDVQRLLQDASIVRHRGKIEAAIHNARRAIDLAVDRGSLAAYFWSFEPEGHASPTAGEEIASQTDASRSLSRDLRKLGWKFVGPTTSYAFMQAMGLVNDHLLGCHAQKEVDRERRALTRPN